MRLSHPENAFSRSGPAEFSDVAQIETLCSQGARETGQALLRDLVITSLFSTENL
jgi:hypothetical protein